MSKRSGGRARLPTWVVRIRSVLSFMPSPPIQLPGGTDNIVCLHYPQLPSEASLEVRGTLWYRNAGSPTRLASFLTGQRGLYIGPRSQHKRCAAHCRLGSLGKSKEVLAHT